MDHKGLAMTIVKGMGPPADDEGDESYNKDGLHAAAQDLLDALNAKDVGGIAAALQNAFELCDKEPHEEGPHVGGGAGLGITISHGKPHPMG